MPRCVSDRREPVLPARDLEDAFDELAILRQVMEPA
jgi:hypothetical protein